MRLHDKWLQKTAEERLLQAIFGNIMPQHINPIKRHTSPKFRLRYKLFHVWMPIKDKYNTVQGELITETKIVERRF